MSQAPDDEREPEIFRHEIVPDMEPLEALKILTSFHDARIDNEWNNFSVQDLTLLSECFSVLKFAPGENIVVLGEVSSFWGVLLSGELQVVIQGTNPVTLALRPGALVGEMAYFTRVPRSGTVVCSIAATMALMTFDELDALPATHSAELQCKIVRLLATKSIRKLEFNMNNMRAAEERQKVEETERELKLKNEETKRLGKKETLITQREKKALAPNEEFNKLSLSRSASVFPPSHSSNKPRRTPKGPQGETSQQRQERERAYFEKQAFDNEQKVAELMQREQTLSMLLASTEARLELVKNGNDREQEERFKKATQEQKDKLEQLTQSVNFILAESEAAQSQVKLLQVANCELQASNGKLEQMLKLTRKQLLFATVRCVRMGFRHLRTDQKLKSSLDQAQSFVRDSSKASDHLRAKVDVLQKMLAKKSRLENILRKGFHKLCILKIGQSIYNRVMLKRFTTVFARYLAEANPKASGQAKSLATSQTSKKGVETITHYLYMFESQLRAFQEGVLPELLNARKNVKGLFLQNTEITLACSKKEEELLQLLLQAEVKLVAQAQAVQKAQEQESEAKEHAHQLSLKLEHTTKAARKCEMAVRRQQLLRREHDLRALVSKTAEKFALQSEQRSARHANADVEPATPFMLPRVGAGVSLSNQNNYSHKLLGNSRAASRGGVAGNDGPSNQSFSPPRDVNLEALRPRRMKSRSQNSQRVSARWPSGEWPQGKVIIRAQTAMAGELASNSLSTPDGALVGGDANRKSSLVSARAPKSRAVDVLAVASGAERQTVDFAAGVQDTTIAGVVFMYISQVRHLEEHAPSLSPPLNKSATDLPDLPLPTLSPSQTNSYSPSASPREAMEKSRAFVAAGVPRFAASTETALPSSSIGITMPRSLHMPHHNTGTDSISVALERTTNTGVLNHLEAVYGNTLPGFSPAMGRKAHRRPNTERSHYAHAGKGMEVRQRKLSRWGKSDKGLKEELQRLERIAFPQDILFN